MKLIKATEEMLAAAQKIVPTQEDVLAKGYITSNEIMCLGMNEKGMFGQYWDIFVNTCFNGKKMLCRQSVLNIHETDNNTELQVYKESPNLYCHREFTKNGTLENWQETEQIDNDEFQKRLALIPEDKQYLVFTLQDFFNQGSWGWNFNQRCIKFIGVCKVNRKLSGSRNAIVWDVIDDVYKF